MKFRLITLFVVFFIISFNSIAQKETSFGIVTIGELDVEPNIRFQLGLVLDHKVTRRSGFEISINSRTVSNDRRVNIELPNGTEEQGFYRIREYWFNIPILYKFHSRIVNIAVGPALDLFMGWKQTSGSPGLEVTGYSINPKRYLGLMGKISKSIPLSEGLILEPELRINRIYESEVYTGFAVAIKYNSEAFKSKFGKNRL